MPKAKILISSHIQFVDLCEAISNAMQQRKRSENKWEKLPLQNNLIGLSIS